MSIVPSAIAPVTFFSDSVEGETQKVRIYGYGTGFGGKESLDVSVEKYAANTADFFGLDAYMFNGNLITLNDTHSDADGARVTRHDFKGEQSGGEQTTLARIEVGHDGTGDDEKGYLDIFINDGDDGDTPTKALRIDSDLLATFAGAISVTGAVTAGSFTGLVIGTDVLAYDAGLQNLAGIAMAADKFYYTSADNTHVAANVTAFARTILDDANAATVRATIGALANTIEDTTPELGGELDAGAHTIGFTQQTTTGDGTTTINWTLGNKFYFTFGAQNETFTFTAPSNPCNLILVVKQDGVGGRTATWPASVIWPDHTPPTLSTGANEKDLFGIYYDGTDYWGNYSLDFG